MGMITCIWYYAVAWMWDQGNKLSTIMELTSSINCACKAHRQCPCSNSPFILNELSHMSDTAERCTLQLPPHIMGQCRIIANKAHPIMCLKGGEGLLPLSPLPEHARICLPNSAAGAVLVCVTAA